MEERNLKFSDGLYFIARAIGLIVIMKFALVGVMHTFLDIWTAYPIAYGLVVIANYVALFVMIIAMYYRDIASKRDTFQITVDNAKFYDEKDQSIGAA
jgi:putative flippase GtrA